MRTPAPGPAPAAPGLDPSAATGHRAAAQGTWEGFVAGPAAWVEGPIPRKATSIHLFGIENAVELGSIPLKALVERAGLPGSYHTEIRKMIELARYVQPK